MNLPRHVPIDDDTIIVVNGISTIPWSGFLRINSFEPEKVEEIRAALWDVGEFHGGGSAAAEFHLTLLTKRVTEFKLSEVERLSIKRSVFFSGLSPDDLAGETNRIAGKLGRAFALTRVESGTRIRRTA
jgi:predicted translin family RNA/ssDNA-binding protein